MILPTARLPHRRADRVALLERRIFLRIVEAELIRPDRGTKLGARIDDLGKQHIRPQFLLRSDGYQSYCLSHTVLINMRLPACGCEGRGSSGKDGSESGNAVVPLVSVRVCRNAMRCCCSSSVRLSGSGRVSTRVQHTQACASRRDCRMRSLLPAFQTPWCM